MESGEQEMKQEPLDSYNNNTGETKSAGEHRERKQNYMRQYEREIEPCTKLSEKVMIPIKKYPKVFITIFSIIIFHYLMYCHYYFFIQWKFQIPLG